MHESSVFKASERVASMRPGKIVVGVGVVCTRRLGIEKYLLLVKRKNDPGKGMYAVPGGKMEFGESIRG